MLWISREIWIDMQYNIIFSNFVIAGGVWIKPWLGWQKPGSVRCWALLRTTDGRIRKSWISLQLCARSRYIWLFFSTKKSISLALLGLFFKDFNLIFYQIFLIAGESLIIARHPASAVIEAHMTTMQSKWAWLLQLTLCLETHLR